MPPIWLLVLLGIVILIVSILFSKVGIVISYTSSLRIYYRLWFFKFSYFKEQQRKKNKKEKKKKKKTSNNQAVEEKGAEDTDNILTTLTEIKKELSDFAKYTLGNLHVKFAYLNIVVASENAAKTAILYGAVTQGVAYIIETLENLSTVEISDSSDISVSTDFLSEKSKIKCKISLYIRIIDLIRPNLQKQITNNKKR